MKIGKKIYYGGDYNPDQWDDATIDEDMRLFKLAGINMVTMPVFSWAKLEPEEGVYEFEWLDRLMDKFAENGISVCLATPTVAQPAWLSTRYPEVLPVDIAGRKRTHGMRVFFCYNSQKYRERAKAIAGAMAKRYSNHKALAVWHVANEYGTYCYCDNCQRKFRVWLRERYGTIEELNERWNTTFWGRIVYSFEEITLPTELNDDYRFNPIITLDYQRFVTDSTVECFENEYWELKKYTPKIAVQTNMSGYIKKLDQFVMAGKMDIVGWDNYPSPNQDKSLVAMKHDIMRGLKDGAPFMLMEQSPNQQNWQPYNKLKKPGEVRLLSYQAMAHGADTCLFFQMRQSVGGQEKFHGAIIAHAGHENTRIFKECSILGKELKQLGDIFIGSRINAKVGILFDWNNWWSLELSSGPSKDMDYLNSVRKYYKAFYDKNIPVDMVGFASDLEKYDVIVAPMLYMMKDGIAEKIEAAVKKGKTLITTTMSGLVDTNDCCVFGEYPGPLREILGIWVEETDALFTNEKNHIVMNNKIEGMKDSYECEFLCDVVHSRGAEVLASFGEDFYAGGASVTVNQYGEGRAYYIGTQPNDAFLGDFIGYIAKEASLKAHYQVEENVEVTLREIEDREIFFVINHNEVEAKVEFEKDTLYNLLTEEEVSGTQTIKGRDVWVLQRR